MKKRKTLLILSSIILMLCGILYLRYTWIASIEKYSEQALEIAQIGATGLNGEMLKKIRAVPEDAGTIPYESIKKRLIEIKSIHTVARFAYLYTRRAGKLYFIADSEPAGSKDYSPPGQAYTEADDEYYKPFENGKALITKTSTDRWGSRVSILIPVKIADTGNVIAVFAIDYPGKSMINNALSNTRKAAAIVLFLFLLIISFYMIINKNLMLKKEIHLNEISRNGLRESEEKHRLLIENSHDIIYILNADGIFTFVSPSITTLLGYTVNEVIGQSFQSFIHPDDVQNCSIRLQLIFNNEKPQNDIEYRIKNSKGIWFWHTSNSVPLKNDAGAVIGLEGISRNITERKNAEELIKNTMLFQQELLNAVPLPIFYKDAEGFYIGCNKAYELFMGLPQENLTGRTVYDIAPADLAEKYFMADRELLDNPGIQTYEAKVVYADGKRHDVIFNKATFTNAEGKIAGLIGVMQDITERKLAENQIRALLAEKELILKEVHHRIKNNMNTIMGLLLLQSGASSEPLIISALDDAGRRVHSMMILYDKLYQSVNSHEISLAEYLPALINEIVSNFPDSNSVKIIKNIDDIVLNANILQPLGIIVNELLTNIMKYAFKDRSEGLINVSAALNGNAFSLIIQDNGVGIPESITFANSTGFGMHLVSMLSEQIGGSIRIERGDGTKFILEFEV